MSKKKRRAKPASSFRENIDIHDISHEQTTKRPGVESHPPLKTRKKMVNENKKRGPG
jgi:hypothetical protein